MTNTMQSLIDEAYRLFSRYTLGSHMAVCDYGCCISETSINILKSTPLQCLDTDILFDYLDSAEGGNEELLTLQMRYLLARILEFIAMGRVDELRHSSEITLNKLHCNHQSWREEELAFLQKFARSHLQQQIIDKEPFYELTATLVMFDNANIQVDDLLAEYCQHILKNADDLEIMESLMDMVKGNIDAFARVELNQKMNQFFQSNHFKNAYLNMLLRKVEDDNYDSVNQDEKNLYEIAFSVIGDL